MTGTVGINVLIEFANEAFGERLGVGGVVPGSLQSIQGPTGYVFDCSVLYANLSSSPQPFRLRFTVTTSTSAACKY